jgi:hypothetical protein
VQTAVVPLVRSVAECGASTFLLELIKFEREYRITNAAILVNTCLSPSIFIDVAEGCELDFRPRLQNVAPRGQQPKSR